MQWKIFEGEWQGLYRISVSGYNQTYRHEVGATGSDKSTTLTCLICLSAACFSEGSVDIIDM